MAQQPVIWKKRILVPFWIIRIILMLFIIAVYAIALNQLSKQENKSAPAIGVVVLFMLLIIGCLLMDILAIVLFLRDSLNPKTFLILNAIQTAFWAVVLLLDFVAIARGASAVGIGFTIFVLFTFVALLVYASIGFHRQRKQAQRGNYAPAHNPGVMPSAGPGYYNGPPQHTQNTSYQGSMHPGAPVELHSPSHGYPQQPPVYTQQGAAADYYQGKQTV